MAAIAGGSIRLVEAVFAEELVVLKIEALLRGEVDRAATAQEASMVIVVFSCSDCRLKEEEELTSENSLYIMYYT